MYQSKSYPPPTDEDILSLIASAFHGKLIAANSQGEIFVSLLPFTFAKAPDGLIGSTFEIHMVQGDSTFQAIRETGRAAFLVDDPLAFTPHHLVDPEDASMATLHFKAALFRCDARLTTDPEEVAAVLARLVKSREGEDGYRPVEAGPYYGPSLAILAAATLTVHDIEAKWKIAQSKPDDVVRRLVHYLKAQGSLGDLRAAEVLERDRLGRG